MIHRGNIAFDGVADASLACSVSLAPDPSTPAVPVARSTVTSLAQLSLPVGVKVSVPPSVSLPVVGSNVSDPVARSPSTDSPETK